MLQSLRRVRGHIGVGWLEKVPEQGPQGGKRKIEEGITGEGNDDWDLAANPPELKSWPGPHPCGEPH